MQCEDFYLTLVFNKNIFFGEAENVDRRNFLLDTPFDALRRYFEILCGLEVKTECLNTRFPLLTLLCEGNTVKHFF